MRMMPKIAMSTVVTPGKLNVFIWRKNMSPSPPAPTSPSTAERRMLISHSNTMTPRIWGRTCGRIA